MKTNTRTESTLATSSRNVPKKERERLIEIAHKMNNASPRILSNAGIPEDGRGKVVARVKKRLPNDIGTIEVTGELSQEALGRAKGKACVFVSCSHKRPGGGWMSGAKAQEESISRESTWGFQAGKHMDWYGGKDWRGQDGALVLDGLMVENGKGREVVCCAQSEKSIY